MERRYWSRRRFLRSTGSGLLLGGLMGGGAGSLLSGCETHTETSRISGGLRSFITPTTGSLSDDFYIQFGYPFSNPEDHPVLANSDWSLAITGAVGDSVTVTFDDLMQAAATDGQAFVKTMRCVLDTPNVPLISNGWWRGVPLRMFVEQAGPLQDAVRINTTGADGFSSTLALDRVLENRSRGVPDTVPLLDVMLVYELNGAPIPSVHGGPVRLLVPEKFGFKNVKYPSEMNVTEVDEVTGYYETELFEGTDDIDIGNIATTSLFSGPNFGEGVLGPVVSFFGVAMTGPAGIDRVELSVDDGAFEEVEIIPFDDVLQDPRLFFGEARFAGREAELEMLRAELLQATDPRFADVMPFVWVLWRAEVELSRGRHSARVRAFGTDGSSQPEALVVGDENGDNRIREVSFTVT